jgi:hypothetical protein
MAYGGKHVAAQKLNLKPNRPNVQVFKCFVAIDFGFVKGKYCSPGRWRTRLAARIFAALLRCRKKRRSRALRPSKNLSRGVRKRGAKGASATLCRDRGVQR